MDYRIEVVTLPVSDVDRALRFYTEQVGFALDVDYRPHPGFRVVQLTPPGSGCKAAADWQGDFAPGADPDRRDYASFLDFADPDGNTWTVQERGHRE